MTGNEEEWTSGIRIGATITCRVVRHAPFGVFVAIDESREGIIERVQMERDGYTTPQEYPTVGSLVEGIVVGFRDWSGQIEVGLPPKLQNRGETVSEQEELIEVGLRLDDTGRLDFFGIDQVNERLRSGKIVKRIEKGRALMMKSGEDKESVRMKFEGFSVVVLLAD